MRASLLLLLVSSGIAVSVQPLEPTQDGIDNNFAEDFNPFSSLGQTIVRHTVQHTAPVTQEGGRILHSAEQHVNQEVRHIERTLGHGIGYVTAGGDLAVSEIKNHYVNQYHKTVRQAKYIARHARIFANTVGHVLQYLSCDIKPSVLMNMIKELFSEQRLKKFQELKTPHWRMVGGLFDENINVQSSSCRDIWSYIDSTGFPRLLQSFIRKAESQCRVLSHFKDKNPAISFEIGASYTQQKKNGGQQTLDASLGIAMDKSGRKFCYIGGCTGKGFHVPPVKKNSGKGEFGWQFNVWSHPKNIAGQSDGIVFNFNKGMYEAGVTYMYEGSVLNFLGVGITGTKQTGAKSPTSIEKQTCSCNICVSTDNRKCG